MVNGFRLRNEMREGWYWEEEENRRCRLCRESLKSWKHVWEECRNWEEKGRSWQKAVG